MGEAGERLKAGLADRYRLECELGAGGMATVYLAEDLRHDRKVAVKVLRPDLAAALGPDRFLREVKIAANLQHPHVLPLYDSGQADGVLYYVMPYVEGISLRQKLLREGELPIPEAVRILRDVADAIAYAHQHGVVHRDIKPENIMLSGRHALVMDFGVAKAVSEATGRQSLTTAGVALGTPTYMSPEQATADPHTDHRADIYAFGVLAYELLSGRPPFTGPSPQAVLAAHVTSVAEPVNSYRMSIPPLLTAIVMKCLEKKPADRWQTADELIPQLEAVLTPSGGITPTVTEPAIPASPTHAPPPPALVLPRRRVTAWLGAVAAVFLVALAGLLWFKRGDSTSASGEVPRLVVLPFENLGAPTDGYFADGITDEITARLSGLSGLAVIARQSAIQYKGTNKTPQQIGEELTADYILEATVSWQRAGTGADRVRIRPQLIRTADATQLWADVVDEDLTEVFAVQTRIATRVVEALGVALLDSERRQIAVVPTTNPEAHDFYLRGLEYTNTNKPYEEHDVRVALGLFERAVQLEPGFAMAHAATAYAHFLLYWYAADRTDARLSILRHAIDQTLKADPQSPEGRINLARYHYARLEFDAAARELLALQATKPHDDEVAAWTGFVYRRQGRFTDAVASLERAVNLDPRSVQWWYNLGETQWLMRNYAAAESTLSRAAELGPELETPYRYLTYVRVCSTGTTEGANAALTAAEQYGLASHPRIVQQRVWLDILDRRYREALQRLRNAPGIESFDWQFWFVPRAQTLAEIFRFMGRTDSANVYYQAARQELESKVREFPEDPRYHSSLAIVYAGLGRREDAVRTARHAVDIMPVAREAVRGAYPIEAQAQVHAMLGDSQAAIAELERLLSIPSHLSAAQLRVDPRWDPIREHPKFTALLAVYGGR